MSVKDALNRYYRRRLEEGERARRPKRKNGSPEFEVVRAAMIWLKANGFSCDVVESKAVYSASAGRYLNSQTTPGFSDIAGACPNGTACFIEAKAPGKRSTLRPAQRVFLMEKIERGCFAVCIDSITVLEKIWAEFEHRQKIDPRLAKNLLLRHLPTAKDDNAGETGLGFG